MLILRKRQAVSRRGDASTIEPFIAIRTMHFPHTVYGWEEAQEKGHGAPVQILASIVGDLGGDEVVMGKWGVPEESYREMIEELVRRLRKKGFHAYIIDFDPYEHDPYYKYAVLVIDKRLHNMLNAYIIYPSPHDDYFVLHLYSVYTNNPSLIYMVPKYFKKFLDLLEYTDEDPLTQGKAEAIFYPRRNMTRILPVK